MASTTAKTLSTKPVSGLRMWSVAIAARIRSQLAYRSSFAADLVSQALLMITEYLEVYVLLHNAPVFGGMNLVQATLVYGLAGLAFGLADMVFGQLDNTSSLIRTGKIDTLMLRPTSLLFQLITLDFQLRRLGRTIVGLIIYSGALIWADIDWSPALVWLAITAPLVGFLIFGASFLLSGSLLFWVIDGQQAGNTVTYGGRYVSSVPGGALFTPLRVFFTFVVPATIVAYVPVAVMTGAPLPPLLWPVLAWLAPLIAVAYAAVVLLIWRLSVRHYTGAGG